VEDNQKRDPREGTKKRRGSRSGGRKALKGFLSVGNREEEIYPL